MSAETEWTLAPPHSDVLINALKADGSPDSIGFLPPFNPTSLNRPQSYMHYYIPTRPRSKNTIDQWVTPAWQDESPQGAVWTNELIHFVIVTDCSASKAAGFHPSTPNVLEEPL